MAGSFKTLDTAGLAVDTQITVKSSPKSTLEGAMEMEVYEWESASGGGTYQCRILANNTGQTLRIAMVSVAATTFPGSCAAAAGSTCDTQATLLGGDLKFQCLVATGASTTGLLPSASYKMALRRTSPVAAPTVNTTPSPSGAIGE